MHICIVFIKHTKEMHHKYIYVNTDRVFYQAIMIGIHGQNKQDEYMRHGEI